MKTNKDLLVAAAFAAITFLGIGLTAHAESPLMKDYGENTMETAFMFKDLAIQSAEQRARQGGEVYIVHHSLDYGLYRVCTLDYSESAEGYAFIEDCDIVHTTG